MKVYPVLCPGGTSSAVVFGYLTHFDGQTCWHEGETVTDNPNPQVISNGDADDFVNETGKHKAPKVGDKMIVAKPDETGLLQADSLTTYVVGTHCTVDGVEIKVMTFKNTGVCSELCRKRRDGDITEESYQAQKAGRVTD